MPAAPTKFNLVHKNANDDDRIVQGATYNLELTFNTDYGSDWTGFACRAQLRAGVRDEFSGDDNVLAEFTCTITDPPNRVVQFSLTAAQTDAITELTGLWDAEIYMTDGDGVEIVYRVVQGRWDLNQGVTA